MFINQLWYGKHWLCFLLWPVSLIYRVIIFIRRTLYEARIKKTTRLSVPVIVVGNLTVGGTGKTPLVMAIANYLISKGYRPGIICRGYRGKAKHWPQRITADSDPLCVGDEAVLLKQKVGCPVAAGPSRVAAAQKLITECECNLIISDDGLQHYALARDVNIAVVEGERRYGNEMCLPAGPLREPLSRLNQVDLIVANGNAKPNECLMTLQIENIYQIKHPTIKLSDEYKKIHAVAGIGNPQRFFNSLIQLGFEVIPHALPDHHAFTRSDIYFNDDLPVIMTEKDAVKCKAFVDERHYALGVHAELGASFWQRLISIFA